MSQRILKALMHLFALFGVSEKERNNRRQLVISFLEELLNKELVPEYLQTYDEYVNLYQQRQSKSGKNKIIAVSSVKLLKIATLINTELTLKQKFIVLIRLLEFIKIGGVSSLEREFVQTIAESFFIDKDEFNALIEFVTEEKRDDFLDPGRILIINGFKTDSRTKKGLKHLYVHNLWGEIFVFNITSIKLFIFKYYDEKELYLNQQPLYPNKIYVFSVGSAIRNPKITPIYYSDIVGAFTFDKIKSKIVFEADRIAYNFRDGNVGIHELSFTERSGKLVGIMGASGSGKTTLLNVLSGIYKPSSGQVLVNGINLHENLEELKGLIGYVSQDDLLIEDLTVFENLYFNAKLVFGDYSDRKIIRIVLNLLNELGLYEIKDMKVGSVLNRKISGGQRKRLNIALELIRQPPILFLDEPTSGLSSRDSENIMDLLKALTLKGKLVFVVIHQPSSDIFKMFDRLLILDHGGYLIYNGPPIEALIYFKSEINAADWSDSQCPVCGNVKPEQIFNIVEAKVLDEYGNLTQIRKISPKEWYERFKKYEEKQKRRRRSYLVRKLPKIPFKIPSRFKQFKIFVARDLLSKLSNTAYLLINFLETPILAAILTFIIRYWDIKESGSDTYLFYYNENFPVYIFMSVIIALFIGITVSAQEIIKDAKIRRREVFLNLSRFSYLSSKLFNLFLISLYQSFIYTLVGNWILSVKGMFFEYWLVLFSVWYFANILGLNISDGFKNTVTIYISIPFLIIPQLILSGVLVNYQKLNPYISRPDRIPWYGELMTAKWAYEALAVKQFKDNKYMRRLYPYEKELSQADYVINWWQPEMLNFLDTYLKYRNDTTKKEQLRDVLQTLYNELTRHQWVGFEVVKPDFDPEDILSGKMNSDLVFKIKAYLIKLKRFYINARKKISQYRDKEIISLKDQLGQNGFWRLKMVYHNEKLEDFVCDSKNKTKIFEYDNRLIRYFEPIYYDPEAYFFSAHFYAPTKPFFGYKVDTFVFNLIVIWIYSLILFALLYFRFIHRIIDFIELLNKKIKNKQMQREEDRLKIRQKKIKRRKKVFFFIKKFIR